VVTSLNNEAAAGSGVFHAIRRQAGSDATIDHVAHINKVTARRCSVGLLRGYIRTADGSFEFGDGGSAGRQSEKGGPGPWLGGHEQSSTVSSRRLVSAVRKLQGRQE
jgi:hypothetical protein